ncbi:MAG: CNNM domain-containing protein [Aquimonas sp.]|nr:CNNM domain-containing protein [Aquimonas sp.]
MNDPLFIALATIALIVLSALCVIIEFALLGARRHRLEELAADSRSARAALRGMNDLTLMLAAAQLGITASTFGLGAVTKPAFDIWLGPVFLALGMPEWVAGASAFAVALFVVTFLHLVVGEMAPKSWAIAHPETSALAIGLVSRAFLWPLRPLLVWINGMANRLVRASGVEPVESAAVGGQDIATIRQLVEHSAKVGTLEPQIQQQISALIDLGKLPVEALATESPVHVTPSATVGDVRKTALQTGQMRILMLGTQGGTPTVVHVRDTLTLPTTELARDHARPAFMLTAKTPVYEALARMRGASVQLAVVMDDNTVRGVIALADILKLVLPAGVAAVLPPARARAG